MSNTECIYFKDLPRIEHFTSRRRRRSPCVRRVGVQSGLRPNAGGTRPFKGWPFVGERAEGARGGGGAVGAAAAAVAAAAGTAGEGEGEGAATLPLAFCWRSRGAAGADAAAAGADGADAAGGEEAATLPLAFCFAEQMEQMQQQQ